MISDPPPESCAATRLPLALVSREGFSSGDEASRTFSACGLYPVKLVASSLNMSAVDAYHHWLAWLDLSFNPAETPWLPIGRVGPILILGHCAPVDTEAPLPSSCFQPVLLDEEDYGRYLDLCTPYLSASGRASRGVSVLQGPRARFPDRFLLPNCEQNGLQFLLDYFPHEPNALKVLTERLRNESTEAVSLPPGYAGALWVVLRQGAVADLSILQATDTAARLLPASLRTELSAISEYRKNLWVAAANLPMPTAEDALLNELGEGWRVHFVLADRPEVSGAEERSDSESDSSHSRSPWARTRLQIEPRGDLRVSSLSGLARSHPGVLHLSEKEIVELERYDPRRPDRDPVKVFLRELSAAVRAGASDLHIEPGIDRARVRARVDGLMEEWLEMSVEFGQTLVGAAKEIVGLPAEKFMPQDGSCTVHHGAEIVSVRVSSYPIRKRRQKLVLRFLPRRGKVPSLDTIMPQREASLLRRASRSPHGLILFCGPTGSGKTTTVFSALSELNSAERNITTMEDPVEYEIEGLNQAELDIHRGVSWDTLLKGFLRQDPDVGLIGEIRDRATAETALRQALTGHVVFATLHTMSCAQTVERLIDLGCNPDMIASALTLVVSQRLLRCLCPICRVRSPIGNEERRLYEKHALPIPAELWRPRASGCSECRQGSKGRTAAVEMLPVTEELAAMIQERKRARDYAGWARRNGFHTVFEAGLLHAAAGRVTIEEACEWQSVWEDFEWNR